MAHNEPPAPGSPKPWEKNGPSPNPGGRPKKSHLKGLLKLMDPASARFLEMDRQVTGLTDRDGNELTYGESLVLTVHKRGLTDNRAAKIYLEYRSAAEAEERDLRRTMGMAAAEHMDRYMKQFEDAERRGAPLPKVLPDPRDFIWNDDGSVTIDGPVTWDQYYAIQRRVEYRDEILQTMAALEPALNEDVILKFWKKLRNRVYRVQSKLPRRLRKVVPMPAITGSLYEHSREPEDDDT